MVCHSTVQLLVFLLNQISLSKQYCLAKKSGMPGFSTIFPVTINFFYLAHLANPDSVELLQQRVRIVLLLLHKMAML